jgi:signal transduction histidine kinase/CheY-like chemotaxis protein
MQNAAARLAGEQLATMATNGVAGAASGLLGALAIGAALIWIEPASPLQVAVWLAPLTAAYAAHVLLCSQWRRRRPRADAAGAWCGRFVLAALAEGLIWAAGILWFCATGPLEQELLVVLIAGGIAGAVGLSFGSYLPAYFARFLPVTLPYVCWAAIGARGHAAIHDLLAACVFFFALGNIQLARLFNASFIAAQRARFDNIDLADALRVQKDAAEAATLAKSRFLAAASHDLRQPVHALSLFVGALQGASLPPDAQRLLDHIDSAVASVDGLFAALLDISRLDAGAVPVRPSVFPIRPLLHRILADHAMEASAKGIALRLYGDNAHVGTDPVLLERILRNLVANAVRYTDDGRVVVGCRRRGATLRIEVWDSGRGIPADEQALVFEEFRQGHAPSGERGPGLGLGLAIVRRLSDLLGLTLALRSSPGRGSCFSVAVPIAAAPADAVLPDDGLAPACGLIVVIDDNDGIRAAMGALLRRWGHTACVGDSGEAALAALGRAPDLIICDYHLASGRNGIATIAMLCACFGQAVPAMLITGDSDASLAEAAQAAGLLLLHKPVPNGRLRAAVGRLLAQSAPAESLDAVGD